MDIGPKGMVSHSSSEKINPDGSGEREANAKDRLKKHGSIISCYGENLSFHCVDAKEVIMGLLVDDGSKTRGHRHNILNPDFNLTTIYPQQWMNVKKARKKVKSFLP